MTFDEGVQLWLGPKGKYHW